MYIWQQLSDASILSANQRTSIQSVLQDVHLLQSKLKVSYAHEQYCACAWLLNEKLLSYKDHTVMRGCDNIGHG